MYEFSLAEFSRKRATYVVLYGGGALLFLLASLLWWTKASVKPYDVFWGMVNNSLATSGVTFEMKSGNDANSATYANEAIQYSLGPTQAVHSITTIKDSGKVVTSEIVGDASSTYSRYTKIQGGDANTQKLLNVWTKAGLKNSDTGKSSQLLSQVALSVGLPMGTIPVPIGNLTNAQRTELMSHIQEEQIYQTSYDKVKRQWVGGHLQYVYTVSMQPILYLDMMKTFSQYVGLHDLDDVDVNEYAGKSAITVALTVDAHARQLVAVDAGQGFSETYSGYGVAPKVTLPKNAVSGKDLQLDTTQTQ